MLTPERVREIAEPLSDQFTELIIRLRGVMHEEIEAENRIQVLTFWSSFMQAYGDYLDLVAIGEAKKHPGSGTEAVRMKSTEECYKALEAVFNEVLDRKGVSLDPMEGA
jgi:hypothetical protein